MIKYSPKVIIHILRYTEYYIISLSSLIMKFLVISVNQRASARGRTAGEGCGRPSLRETPPCQLRRARTHGPEDKDEPRQGRY